MTERVEISADEVTQQLTTSPAFGFFVDLSNKNVVGNLDLSRRTLCGFDLTNTRFSDAVVMEDCIFKGISWFRSAEFAGPARFCRSCFFNDARFDGSRFSKGADFAGSEFRGIATFDHCSAMPMLNFDRILANGNFSIFGADLADGLSLTGAKLMGGLWSDEKVSPPEIEDGKCEVYGRLPS